MRQGKMLTLAAYRASGGLHGAIATTAEDVYSRFTPGQARIARHILLRLIAPGDGAPDTRRRIEPAELESGRDADTALVLDALAQARLLVLDDGAVELAHEALIDGWQRLRSWIDEDRERLRRHRRPTQAAQEWEKLGKDPGALYRGERLATAEEIFRADIHSGGLTTLERTFLAAGDGPSRPGKTDVGAHLQEAADPWCGPHRTAGPGGVRRPDRLAAEQHRDARTNFDAGPAGCLGRGQPACHQSPAGHAARRRRLADGRPRRVPFRTARRLGATRAGSLHRSRYQCGCSVRTAAR